MLRPDSTRYTAALLLTVLIAVLTGVASAQDATLDPTEPPAILQETVQRDEAQPDQPDTPAAMTDATPPNRLTLIAGQAIRGSWRRQAVVDNRVVAVGKKTERGTIERIGPSTIETSDESGSHTRSVIDHGVIKETPSSRIKE